MNNNNYELAPREPVYGKGQKEFENLYGPLEEHMIVDDPWEIDCIYKNIPLGASFDIEKRREEEKNRLTILSIFKERTSEGFLGFLEEQKMGTILTKEELASKKEFWMAGVYVDSKIRELVGEKSPASREAL